MFVLIDRFNWYSSFIGSVVSCHRKIDNAKKAEIEYKSRYPNPTKVIKLSRRVKIGDFIDVDEVKGN